MPRADLHVTPLPLSRTEIQKLLAALFHDPVAPPEIAIEAFTVTAAALYGWCVSSDVDAALVMPTREIPTDRGTSQCQWCAPN